MKTATLQFSNPPMEALRSSHQHFTIEAGRARKYPADVTPFAAIEDDSAAALQDLFSIMKPGEATYIVSEAPPFMPKDMSCGGQLGVKQMTYPHDQPLPDVPEIEGVSIEPLSCANAAEMVELTSIAFPGFFRIRTCEMGKYYGIRAEGRLVAMCGERIAIRDYREISGLCTHPDLRGRGYAAVLMMQLMRDHRVAGLRSYLHVSANNANAIALYERMGFEHRGEFSLYLVTRTRESGILRPRRSPRPTVNLPLPGKQRIDLGVSRRYFDPNRRSSGSEQRFDRLRRS
jgi:ribosomal protein S18 acetylase RimI-like enzyme